MNHHSENDHFKLIFEGTIWGTLIIIAINIIPPFTIVVVGLMLLYFKIGSNNKLLRRQIKLLESQNQRDSTL